MVRPKKHLGQHFLNNESVAERIADALRDNERVLEIGPGTGMLTNCILKKAPPEFLAVEKDPESIEYLQQHFPSLEVIQGDILNMNWDFFNGTSYSLVGNLPYNISSPIFFEILQNRESIVEGVFMIQKEVGERIMSPHGTKAYGILSVLIQLFYSTEKILLVKPGNFFPPPKVDSVVIRLERNQRQMNERLFLDLKRIVKCSFNQRRKKLKNSLNAQFPEIGFVPEEFLSKRAEELSPDDFICMAENFYNLPG